MVKASTFEEAISLIKDRLDIVDVVSQFVVLKKSGANYWGLCPFHNDSKPSMAVSPQKGIYKCFACGEGGDVLKFLVKVQNREYKDVILELAEKFGIELPDKFEHPSSETKSQRKQMIDACRKAAKFYHTELRQAEDANKAMTYLRGRGITDEIIDKFTLGWAPNKFDVLYKELKKEFNDDILEKAGLILKSHSGSWIDRFRNRIIIPIQNENGDYIAFGARAVDEGQNPKYLNSSDSMIYNKSKTLFGLNSAKDAIQKEDSVVIMEGYFDVISAQANGVGNCVASCGTAMTADHIKLLSRYTKSRKIYLSFDTDAAGQKATNRNAELLREAFQGLGSIKQFDESYISTTDDRYSCEIRVIAPPEGKDPDEFIRSVGAESYKQYMENAPLLIDFQINSILKHKNEIKSPMDKTRFVKELIPILEEINNEIIQSEYIKMVAGTLNINDDALYREVKKAKKQNTIVDTDVSQIVKKNLSISEKAQKNLLSVFLVTDCNFTFQQINEMIGDTPFTDEMLINVKSTIDKSINSVNNVKELIEKLYTAFLENPEIQSIITDLISISETFSHLDDRDFQNVIRENINKIIQCQKDEEKEQMRNLYKSANDNETEALKIQIQLRDKINNRLKLEKMND